MGRNFWIAAATAIVLACGVSACGSDDEDTGGASDGATQAETSNAQATAKESLAKLTKAPTGVGVDEPLSKAPQAGKTIAIMNCGTPSCTAWAEAAKQAVAAVRWKPQVFDQGTAPQKIGAAWNQVVRLKPDGVMNIGIPKAAIANQLKKLEAADIPVVNAAVGDQPGDGQVAILSGPETATPVGASQADAIVAEVGDEANVVYHTSPEFPVTSVYKKGFVDRMKELCSSCKVEDLDLSAAGAATGENVTKIVNYLRSHPDVNYLAGNDGVMVGVPNGLRAAGLSDRVGIIGQSSGPTQFAYLEERSQSNAAYKATSYFPPFETAWRGVDVLARQFNGDPLDPVRTPVPFMVLTPDNLPSDISKYFPIVDGYQDKFKKLWRLGG